MLEKTQATSSQRHSAHTGLTGRNIMANGHKQRLITSGLKLCETLHQITYFSLFSILHNQPFQNEEK